MGLSRMKCQLLHNAYILVKLDISYWRSDCMSSMHGDFFIINVIID